MELVKSSLLVLCRDSPTLEVLLTQRARDLSLPLHWVFPGGRRDPQPDGSLENGKSAALREGAEEIGVHVPDALYLDTFRHLQEARGRLNQVNVYAAPMPENQQILPNPLEVEDAQWFTPLTAIDYHHSGKLKIPPLTLESLYTIAGYASTGELLHFSNLRNFLATPCRSIRYMIKMSQK